VKRPDWKKIDGDVERYELWIVPDTILAVYRDEDDGPWIVTLFESDGEETPFLSYTLPAHRQLSTVQRIAITRVRNDLAKLVRALEKMRAA